MLNFLAAAIRRRGDTDAKYQRASGSVDEIFDVDDDEIDVPPPSAPPTAADDIFEVGVPDVPVSQTQARTRVCCET